MTFSEFIGRYFSVRKCPVCGTLLPYERRNEAFCDECRRKWDVAKTHECRRCGRIMPECICMTRTLANAGALCHHKAVAYSSSLAVAHNTLMFIKRNKNPRVTSFLASQLCSVLEADKELPELTPENTVVSFVPRGRRAVLQYGVDQSELIARALAEKLGLECIRCLRRVKDGKEQKKLSASARAKNVKKLYAPVEGLAEAVSGKRIILVDDVITTGASMAACISYLRRARARDIICLSVASTEENK